MHVDLSFSITVRGTLKSDHAYPLFSAISHIVPELHGNDAVGVHPILGQQIGGRNIAFDSRSRLQIRVPTQLIAKTIVVAGRQLNVRTATINVGVPEVRPLTPWESLRCRLVTVKGYFDTASFEEAIRRHLTELVSGTPTISIGRKRTFRIKNREIVGFDVGLHRLTDSDSIAVQTNGIGGRRRFGCGLFVPLPRRRENVQKER